MRPSRASGTAIRMGSAASHRASSTGIGFLGAGVILQHNNIQHVKGLTTAAAIWLTAAIGLMCGIGELKLATVATALAIAVLLLDYFGSRFWPKLPKSESVEDEFTPRDGD